MSDLITSTEAAALIGVPPGRLSQWRSSGKYHRNEIPEVKGKGRSVFYKREDVEKFAKRYKEEALGKKAQREARDKLRKWVL